MSKNRPQRFDPTDHQERQPEPENALAALADGGGEAPPGNPPLPPAKAGATTADPEPGARGPATFVRVPFGAQTLKMNYLDRPGFHRHWFNDDDRGRVARAQKAGYTHVLDEDGKPVSMPVGVREGGGALRAYLMEIPQEWFQEDQAAGQKLVDEIDEAIYGGRLEQQPGESHRYIPQTGINIRTTAR